MNEQNTIYGKPVLLHICYTEIWKLASNLKEHGAKLHDNNRSDMSNDNHNITNHNIAIRIQIHI